MTKQKTTRYLTISLLVVISVCVLVFSVLGYSYRSRSDAAVQEVSQLYMSKMNELLGAHFETAVDYCLARLDSIVAEVPPQSTLSFDEADRRLTSAGLAHGFTSIALMGDDGLLQPICGGQISLLYPEVVYRVLAGGGSRIGIGSLDGKQVEVCAVPARYPMPDRRTSIAIMGVLSDGFLRNILTLDVDGSNVTSYIMRPDGSYVLRDDSYGDNYYSDVMDASGDGESRRDDERYIEDLKAALLENQSFSGSFIRDGTTVFALATPLAYSQWFLLTEMPEGALTQTVGDLGSDALFYVLLACAAVLLCLGAVFIGYYRLSRAQLEEIEQARAAAEQANKAKSEFFSNMSHDIRTPMNAIVGMTSIAMSRIDNKEAVLNSLQKISLSSKQLLGLINDVLDMSRIESGKLTLHMEQMSLREFMDSVVAIIQPQIAAKRQEFDVYVDNVTVENVYCDAVRLNQVLLNLLANAVKFTPEGGRITLAVYEAPSELGDQYITVHIDVSDNGIGMSEEFQKEVFESFAREEVEPVRSTEGVGLGMAITKYIVDAMQGSIRLESEQGKGSSFQIALDLEKAEVPEEYKALPHMRVLIIDDDEQVGEGARASLETLGVEADTALDGQTGIERLKDAIARQCPYDVVLVDWKLPFMNGVQTVKRIHEEISEDTPLLLMSAYDWADVEEEALAACVDGFLAKPLFKSTLYHGLMSIRQDLPQKRDQKKFDFGGKRLLVAEDNDINWEIMETLLEQYNFDVDRASDGKEAVARFSMSPNGYYDAILMDVHMPVLNGLEATEQIRAMHDQRRDATLPIIAMTADAFADDIRRSMDAGMNAHVSKPIDMDEMLRTLAKFIRQD